MTNKQRVLRALALLVKIWGGGKELLIDCHIYGGALLVAFGLAMLWRPAAAPLTLGIILLYIGLRRP
jgi:hypothetical protein